MTLTLPPRASPIAAQALQKAGCGEMPILTCAIASRDVIVSRTRTDDGSELSRNTIHETSLDISEGQSVHTQSIVRKGLAPSRF